MTTVLLDTHVLIWWSTDPSHVSQAATAAIESADELAIASISWYELAWLAQHERITSAIPVRSWLDDLSEQVRTIGTTPAIATMAVSLPSSFPRDPADRLIYATAIEQGWPLVTKDERLRRYRHPRRITIW